MAPSFWLTRGEKYSFAGATGTTNTVLQVLRECVKSSYSSYSVCLFSFLGGGNLSFRLPDRGSFPGSTLTHAPSAISDAPTTSIREYRERK